MILGVVACAAIGFAVLALRHDQPLVPVWVVQRSVDVGATLAEGQPRLTMVAPALRPEGALDAMGPPDSAAVARWIPAHSIVTEADLVGSPRSRQLIGDEVQLILQPSPAAVAMLEPGAIVDIWGRDDACTDMDCPPHRLGRAGRVISVGKAPEDTWGSTDETVTALVVVHQDEIGPILMAEANGSLSFVLQPASAGLTSTEDGEQS